MNTHAMGAATVPIFWLAISTERPVCVEANKTTAASTNDSRELAESYIR